MGDSRKRGGESSSERGKRLAAALKENLKRRKAQSRARRAAAIAVPQFRGKTP